MTVRVRRATADDEAALHEIDVLTWDVLSSPAPPRADDPFFSGRRVPDEVLVAELDGAVAGYAVLRPPTPVPASAHVLAVEGIGVHPRAQRRGVARALLAGAEEAARRRGCTRLTLRVLAWNEPARALYAAAGFVEEGVLRGEFRLAPPGGGDPVDVDDHLLAKRLA